MLIAHVVFRFDYGGLENGVVNVIKGTSDVSMRHVVIALTEATDFADRLPAGIEVHSIRKRPGKDLGAYVRLYRLIRRIRPDIVHTRNIGTMDCALVAFLARIPIRIHGEHGWDIFDPDGTKLKYRWMRRVLHRFVHRVVTVSLDLKDWLETSVGIPAGKIQHICNGVDADRFFPRLGNAQPKQAPMVIGSITRFSPIKDPLNLVSAFIKLRQTGGISPTAELLMIGDGELHEQALAQIRNAGLQDVAWLPGSRDDVPEVLEKMDIFVLGSLKEGVSNTILEAMSSGLPIVASDAGGNAELVEHGVNGSLVAPGDSDALAAAIKVYVDDPDRRLRHGLASRDRVMSRFSLTAMVDNYRLLYQSSYDSWGN